MEYKDFHEVELAADRNRSEVGRVGTAVLFIVGVIVFTGTESADTEQGYMLVAAVVVGAYMAINIGANDVGPAVGSMAMAMTMAMAICIAAVFEAAGAIIAGDEVVSTVKNGIVDPVDISDPNVFVWMMMAALLRSGPWPASSRCWTLGTPVGRPPSRCG